MANEIENQNPKQKNIPKLGVVVGSGGIKSLSSIALFEFLDEAKIDVDLLIGCSGGSSVIGAWVSGHDAIRMRQFGKKLWGDKELFSYVDYKSLLSIANMPFGRFDKTSGLVKPDLAHKAYETMYGDRKIEDLPIRTIFQTTDLLSGEPVMVSKGMLREAVYASGALFPILPPIKIVDRWLIDGAYSSPLPVLEAVKQGADVVVAMTYEERTTVEPKNFLDYYMRSISYNLSWLQRSQLALSVDLHHYEIILINVIFDKHIGLRATDRIPEILEVGQNAVEKKKNEILEAIKNFSSTKQI
jgi:NTE family protein